jgi:mono/diheme cytochrome c family protein
MFARPSFAALAIALALLGCTEPPTTPPRELTYYQDVKPILDAHCVGCHTEGGLGPFPLDSYEAVSDVAEMIPEMIESRQMPPFLAAPAVRPLAYDTSLSDEQIALVSRWVREGARMGDATAEAPPIELPRRTLDRADRTLEMPQPYTPTRLPDEYRCFVLDWTETEPTYITGVEFAPGNLAIAHHAVIYLVDAENTAAIDAANGADGAMGYSCFGGASPDNAPAFPTKLVASWVPGMGASPYPAGTGVLVRPGARVVLQMHYSILSDGAQPDLSSVRFRLADRVEHNAGNLPWLDLNWPATPESMTIPAGEAEVTHEYVGDPTQSPLLAEFASGADASEGLILYSVLPHMHKLGSSMSLQVERADGRIEPLVEISRWDFNWQSDFVFAEPVTVMPGDQIRIRCTWDNSAANQPIIGGVRREPQDVTWGEGTYDEMCAASFFVRGVATPDTTCLDVGSVDAPAGRFVATFDASASVRSSANLEGELAGPVYASIFRAEDVTFTGPRDGAEPVGRFTLDLDLRAGASAPIPIDVELPAGDYQILGFMDTDGNADPASASPDLNDPVLIPGRALTLQCETQPIALTFPLLLPNL